MAFLEEATDFAWPSELNEEQQYEQFADGSLDQFLREMGQPLSIPSAPEENTSSSRPSAGEANDFEHPACSAEGDHLISLSIAMMQGFNNPSEPEAVKAFSHVLPNCICNIPSLKRPLPFSEFLPLLIERSAKKDRTTTVWNSTADVMKNKTAIVFLYVKIKGNPDGMAREAVQILRWKKIGVKWMCYSQTALRSAEGITV